MQEFSSISVSSYEAESLSDRLTEQSAAGWSVVAVVPAGSQVVAYLSRESSGDAASAVEAAAVTGAVVDMPVDVPAVVANPVVDVPVVDVPVVDVPVVADPVAEAPGWATTPIATPEPAPVVAAAATAAAAPAGWYADPSSRFDLRYWDGSEWTEHVSRNGQQATDPPVA